MKLRNTLAFLAVLVNFSCQKEKTLFTRLSPEETGVDFVNEIIENDSINILTFEYTYNGSGVALADFNNDGLKDIFFSANMSGNRLYLNRGELKFEDVSEKSGLFDKSQWYTGAVAVDINADGWMDIYVPSSSTNNSLPEVRKNRLFVNQKGELPTFKEMAEEYGVADDGFSEGAAFFDYDNDGDLDLYVLTNRIDQNPNLFRKKVKDGSYLNTDRLYRCDWQEGMEHPVYQNVSGEAGVLIEGFGLGVNILDINKDGWKDIFVTNDYASNDLMYINQHDGTFVDKANQYFKHMGYSAMGNDVADINNDGNPDIYVLDMMPEDNFRKKMFIAGTNPDWFKRSDQWNYVYQYMRNTLQLNSGEDGSFQEIGLLSGVAETDWSWTPTLADFDNDGFLDLLVTNGFPKDITERDFMQYRAEAQQLVSKKKLLTQIPEVKISNYAYRNKGDLTFENVTEAWGMEIPSFSSGAAFADLDNDGDLDYVVCNTSDPAFIYKNTQNDNDELSANYLDFSFIGQGKNPNGIGAVVVGTIQADKDYYFEMNPYRGYKSSVQFQGHIGLGKQDAVPELTVIWPNGLSQTLKNVKANQKIEFKQAEAQTPFDWASLHEIKSNPLFEVVDDLQFVHHEHIFHDINIQSSLPFSLADMGPGAAVADVNGDGLDDVFVGGAKFKKGVFFLQNAKGQFTQANLLPPVDTLQKRSEDLGVLFFDADGDGDQDLYIVSGGNEDHPNSPSFQDRLYSNDGSGHFNSEEQALPVLLNSGACVRAADFDQDGDLDLFVSGRNTPTQYPKVTSSTLLRNDSKNGQIKFSDVSQELAPCLTDIGLITDALWTDFDNDNDLDLILAGDFMPIQAIKNEGGRFALLEKSGLEDYQGIWNSITSGDYDQDGDIDYIVGNVGENGLFKGSKDYPAMLLSGDFDGNKNYDVLPFVYFPDENGEKVFVPYNGKDDISRQLSVLRTRFNTYKAFSEVRANDLLTEEEQELAEKHYLNYNATALIENLGGGKFTVKRLPMQVQFAPVSGMLTGDFDQDGLLDVLFAGNKYNNEMFVGKMDALNGLLLLGNGDGTFTVRKHSGFNVPGNARSLVSLSHADGTPLYLALQNNGPAKMFRSTVPAGNRMKLSEKAKRYTYSFNGHKILMEANFGSSYLSQSSRTVWVPNGVTDFSVKE
ncbi:VCBS repeat-containing protein [Marinilongibacter aquaticus]|uniref:VCBS repeat-containing protein n=1 Tax=Marinilongibacter aquaticus TaxID=2975157 RepID=UPI0021BD59E0|nr:VCBS repeat-containing protein [Marinilongibacter aquaticus]UBM60508.1 VCBS repeat-containing protein [Marinilongibacter aquaticus]